MLFHGLQSCFLVCSSLLACIPRNLFQFFMVLNFIVVLSYTLTQLSFSEPLFDSFTVLIVLQFLPNFAYWEALFCSFLELMLMFSLWFELLFGLGPIYIILTPDSLFVAIDPFADASTDDTDAGTKEYVHVRTQQRNGRKSLTTVQGLRKEYNYNKILKDFKKEFCCNGTVVQDPELGQVYIRHSREADFCCKEAVL